MSFTAKFIKFIRAKAPDPPAPDGTMKLSSGITIRDVTSQDTLDAMRYAQATYDRQKAMSGSVYQGMVDSMNAHILGSISGMQGASSAASGAAMQAQFASRMWRGSPNIARDQFTYKAPPHPMKTPPLFRPFPIVQHYDEQYVCSIETKPVGDDEDLSSNKFPEVPVGCTLAEEFGMILRTDAVAVHGGSALVLGVDPLHVAWLMRLAYTAVQCDQSLPQTLPMLQIAGRTKITDAIVALPGVGDEGWARLVNHLMFGTQPWCQQFQRGLRAALDPDEVVSPANIDDQRMVYVSRDLPAVPLIQMITAHSQGSYIRKVRNITAFWREAHPVAMDWGAVL